jgi:tetratricopeptide (TPR) repeat protein
LRPIAKSLGELAYQRGGVVLEIDDASLVLAFGLEVAGEDDVAVAMGWALDAAAMARDAGGSLRIGARTGVASAHDSGIAKESIDEARAIAKDASPDRPMFMGAAGRVTSGLYELREVPRRIGRRSRAVMEVVAPRGFGAQDRSHLERRGLFVGRTQQLAELEVWFQRAIAADRRLTALVAGPAGTGKSRLVAELIARRGTQPMRVIMTGATPASQLAPFALVIDLYQAALGMPPSRGRAARAQTVQRLLHLMKEAGAPDERARAVATDLDRAMELRDGVGVSPEVADLRPRISAGLAAFRAAMVDRSQPLLTIIEDIHLSDGASLEVLRHTLGVTALGPELLLLTARPEGATPPAVDVVIGVSDLVGPEQKALITDRLGDAATPLNIATVMQRGGGNPLFIEELAQAVREAGAEVPASARDVVAARVGRLSPKAKTALHFAALLGGSVRARLIEELLSAESLEAELDELVEAGFLVRAGEGELTFTRGLDREVIYESMSPRALRENHARVGRLFASRFFAGREEPPAVIAEHMERGGEIAGAAAFWLRAGKLALTASDAQSAVAHFTRTLTLDRELGATPPTATSRARRREALVGRDEANRMLGDVVSHPHDLDELQKLCEGDPRRLADVSIRRAHRLLRLGDYAGASVATVVAEDFAMTAEDQRLRGEALRVRSEVLERLGRFDEALLVVDDARELFAREGAVADEMAAMVGRGRIHLMRAHYEAARDAYRPVIQRIEKTGDPWLERIVQNHVAIIEMCLGNFSLAMASAERSLDLCRRYGDRSREGDALSVAGIILLEVGLYDQAAARFAEALDLLSRTASRWGRADSLIYAGLCEVHRGRPAEGLLMLDEALAESRRLGARYLEANALISRAGAHIRIGNFPSAIADAAGGTAVAQTATLVGYEIQGLARQAFATLLTRDATRLGEAGNLAHRALVLIEQQHYLEGSEEEVYANCYSVLISAGAVDRANAVKAQGRYEVERKLAGLSDPAWRMAYSAIRENRLLLS